MMILMVPTLQNIVSFGQTLNQWQSIASPTQIQKMAR